MPLTGSGLADMVGDKFIAAYDIPSEGAEETRKYWKPISEAIIEYFLKNAEIHPGTFATPDGKVAGMGEMK
jgi:hypothetical protein